MKKRRALTKLEEHLGSEPWFYPERGPLRLPVHTTLIIQVMGLAPTAVCPYMDPMQWQGCSGQGLHTRVLTRLYVGVLRQVLHMGCWGATLPCGLHVCTKWEPCHKWGVWASPPSSPSRFSQVVLARSLHRSVRTGTYKPPPFWLAGVFLFRMRKKSRERRGRR